jgi:hypothetical protein
VPREEMTIEAQGMRHARGALAWGALFFVLAQVGLLLAFQSRMATRDPEYDFRLTRLKAKMKQRAPGRPLVLFLGSSRIALSIQPGVMAVNQPSASGGPVVFNFGMIASGPVMELLCLRRLLADGVRPDAVIVEIYHQLVTSDMESDKALLRDRFRWDDMNVVSRYDARVRSERLAWLRRQLVPWASHRDILLRQWMPSWFSPRFDDPTNRTLRWLGLDDWGWNFFPSLHNVSLKERYQRIDSIAPINVPIINRFTALKPRRKALEELADLCRQEKIALTFILMPDVLRDDYSPEGRIRVDTFLRALSRDKDVPVIDASAWAAEEDFVDQGHLTFPAAAELTRRLEREVVQPFLAGELFTRRWPVATPVTPPLIYHGKGFSSYERVNAVKWRWCGPEGELILLNPSERPRSVVLRFNARTRLPGTVTRVALQSSFLSATCELDANGKGTFEHSVTLPPGEQVLRLSCVPRPSQSIHWPEKGQVLGLANSVVVDAATPLASGQRLKAP